MSDKKELKYILAKRPEDWNFIRNDYVDTIDLTGTDLSRMDLTAIDFSKVNLTNVNLSRAKLSQANFSEANLSGANLYKAKLYDTNLSGANLFATNLSGANLSEATLYKATLIEANLSESRLSRANLSRANLSKANLTKVNLYEANLSRAKLTQAKFINTNLYGTIFTDSIFDNTFFSSRVQLSSLKHTLTKLQLNGIIFVNDNKNNALTNEEGKELTDNNDNPLTTPHIIKTGALTKRYSEQDSIKLTNKLNLLNDEKLELTNNLEKLKAELNKEKKITASLSTANIELNNEIDDLGEKLIVADSNVINISTKTKKHDNVYGAPILRIYFPGDKLWSPVDVSDVLSGLYLSYGSLKYIVETRDSSENEIISNLKDENNLANIASNLKLLDIEIGSLDISLIEKIISHTPKDSLLFDLLLWKIFIISCWKSALKLIQLRDDVLANQINNHTKCEVAKEEHRKLKLENDATELQIQKDKVTAKTIDNNLEPVLNSLEEYKELKEKLPPNKADGKYLKIPMKPLIKKFIGLYDKGYDIENIDVKHLSPDNDSKVIQK